MASGDTGRLAPGIQLEAAAKDIRVLPTLYRHRASRRNA